MTTIIRNTNDGKEYRVEVEQTSAPSKYDSQGVWHYSLGLNRGDATVYPYHGKAHFSEKSAQAAGTKHAKSGRKSCWFLGRPAK